MYLLGRVVNASRYSDGKNLLNTICTNRILEEIFCLSYDLNYILYHLSTVGLTYISHFFFQLQEALVWTGFLEN